jgi:hypothetical protein
VSEIAWAKDWKSNSAPKQQANNSSLSITLSLSLSFQDGNNFGVDVQRDVLKVVLDRTQILGQYASDLSSYHWSRGAVVERGWSGKKVRVGVEEEEGTEVKGKGGEEGEGKKVVEGDGAEEKEEEEASPAKKRKTTAAAAAQSASLAPPSDPNFMPGKKKTTTTASSTSTKTTKSSTTSTKKSTLTTTANLVMLPDYLAYLIQYDVKWFLFAREAFRVLADSILLVCDTVEKNYDKAFVRSPNTSNVEPESTI